MNRQPRNTGKQHDEQALQWRDALDLSLVDSCGVPCDVRNSSPDVRLLAWSEEGNQIDVELRFRTGVWYCCAEWGCHLHVYRPNWWLRLRDALEEKVARRPPSMSITIYAMVEEGAMLRCLETVGVSPLSKAYTYSHGPIRERQVCNE
jgi:hypothetical protein